MVYESGVEVAYGRVGLMDDIAVGSYGDVEITSYAQDTDGKL